MKKRILYILLIVITISCTNQTSEIININSSKVNEIIIKNKVSYSQQELIDGQVVISDNSEIESFLKLLNQSKIIVQSPSLNANFGFFDIEIIEGKKSHLIGIAYTVYDGVVIFDSNSTKRYKNNELEEMVYRMFVK